MESDNCIKTFWKTAFEFAEELKRLNQYDRFVYQNDVEIDKEGQDTGYVIFKFYKNGLLQDILKLRRN